MYISSSIKLFLFCTATLIASAPNAQCKAASLRINDGKAWKRKRMKRLRRKRHKMRNRPPVSYYYADDKQDLPPISELIQARGTRGGDDLGEEFLEMAAYPAESNDNGYKSTTGYDEDSFEDGNGDAGDSTSTDEDEAIVLDM